MHLVRVENLQEGFVDVWLALETVLDLVDIVDGVVELHRLVVLHGRAGGGPAEWRVELHGRRPRRGVRRDGRIALAARCQRLGLKRLEHERRAYTYGMINTLHLILFFPNQAT